MSSQQAAYLLREFYECTHWNHVDNHYASFTHQSRQILDFGVQSGLHLSIASHPTVNLASGLALSSLVPETNAIPHVQPQQQNSTTAPVLGAPVSPLLSGQLSYLFTSTPITATSTIRGATGSDRVKFKQVCHSYGTEVGIPSKPHLRDEVRPTWKGGERVDKSDYLLYGRLYAPNPRLDALYVHRMSRTTQLLVSLITVPCPTPSPTLSWQNNNSDDPSSSSTLSNSGPAGAAAASSSQAAGTLARLSELEFKLQQDRGRWSSEYSYAVGDGMWGARALYNFGKSGSGASLPDLTSQATSDPTRGLEEEDGEEEMPTGLKGRWSAGGEVYFSAQERSAGLSTGLRFSTIPESAGGPSQPPTTVTATLNPIMGQLSTAYAVQTSKDSSLASRFDFNMYSYDADLSIGGEWFQRKNKKGKAKDTSIEETRQTSGTFDAFGRGVGHGEEQGILKRKNNDAEDEITAVLKLRASTNSDVAMTWEGRLGDFLVSLGVVADLRLATQSRGRVSPIQSVGLGISYWA
ncbi:Mdm10p [Sporobolomyces koalae]|uniref:Mdm10p n=1 Tax=Sporobolomyces koalae TaxID=500713 RepID=UPI003173703B